MTPMNKYKLYILVGIPGCGKTTWAKNVLAYIKHISSDDIRKELFGDDPYDRDRNHRVFETFYKSIDLYLDMKYHVVADATNLRDFARAELRRIAQDREAETNLIFFQNASQAVVRNARRPTQEIVPADDMVNMLENYERARQSIPFEDYDFITYIGNFS